MKKYNQPIDEVFREALNDHRMVPSDAAKKAFMKDVMLPAKPAKKEWRGLFLLSAFLVLIIAGITTWTVKTSESAATPERRSAVKVQHAQQADEHNTISKTEGVVDHSSPARPTIATPGVEKAKSTTKKDIPTNKTNQKKILNTPTTLQPANQHVTGKSNISTTYPEDGQPEIKAAHEYSTAIPIPEIKSAVVTETYDTAHSVEKPVQATSAPVAKTDSAMTKPYSYATPSDTTSGKNRQKREKNTNLIPTIGFYYTPEWMFNTLEGSKFVNNFGIEGIFRFDRFSIRTGAGFSIAQGTNELIVEYNDYLGEYNKLDSMTFTWNEPIHNYIPTMYLSEQDVWDSLLKLDYAKVVKKYTYLQIPLIMGYDFWQSDRLSLGVRAGPVLSILVSSKQQSAAYDPEQKRVISMNDIAPEQVNLNWQGMAGFSIGIRLPKNLIFEVEPSLKYYFNSVYEKPANNTKPWSVGIRAAFLIKL